MRMRIYVLALATAFASAALDAREARTINQNIEVEKGKTVRLEIPVAELEIEAGDRSDVEVELRIRCRWQLRDCEEAIERLQIESRVSNRRHTIQLIGYSSWRSSMLEVDGLVEIPLTSALEVKMGVADLDITGVNQDIRIDVGVGKIRARLPEESIGEAFIDVGVGQVRVLGSDGEPDARRSFLVGTDVQWSDGPGRAELDIEVGVGEVTIRLD